MKKLLLLIFILGLLPQSSLAKKTKKRVPANQVHKIILNAEAGHTTTVVAVTIDQKNHIEFSNSNGIETQGFLSKKSADFIVKKLKALPINKKSKFCRGSIVSVNVEPNDNKDRSACLSYRNKITGQYADFANLLLLARDQATRK